LETTQNLQMRDPKNPLFVAVFLVDSLLESGMAIPTREQRWQVIKKKIILYKFIVNQKSNLFLI